MPENEFIIKCKENMNDNKVNITKVAEYFGVSVQAATVRGNVLGLW
jgi:Zn-dependent peptidase ImmA (M78 family)